MNIYDQNKVVKVVSKHLWGKRVVVLNSATGLIHPHKAKSTGQKAKSGQSFQVGRPEKHQMIIKMTILLAVKY